MTRMTNDQIDCCRRIGRDEVAHVTTIGLAEIDALCAEAKQRGAERDAAADAARAMRETLCTIAEQISDPEVKDMAERVLGETALHSSSGGKSWRGMAVECKGWEHRARAAEAALEAFFARKP